jgi:hypothetical protein
MRRLLFLFLLSMNLYAADSIINIDQAGDNNSVTITQQDTSGHSVDIKLGKSSPSDNNDVTITQQGVGVKSANVEIPSGFNNTVSISQDGSGQHTTNIQNLNGSGNGITVSQSGDGTHTFNVMGGLGTTNSGNTVNATQSGGAGADKTFTLDLLGTVGATVNVEQTNPFLPDSGSMTINCLSGMCGTYSYIRQ